ncbi:MAG: PorT family protein [bacterium]|nr:PorT family protein [bacterium]
MKKIFSTVFIFVIFTCSIFAQDLEFGLKGGVNVSSLNNEGSELDSYKPKPGLLIGVFGTFGTTKNSALKTELLYSMEGANHKDSDTFVRLHRLAIPILFNYKLTESVRLEAGPELKYQIGFDSDFLGGQDNLEGTFHDVDYGLSVGFEIKPISKIGISVRNYFGLKYHGNSIFSDENGNVTAQIRSDRTNVLSVALNYYLKN